MDDGGRGRGNAVERKPVLCPAVFAPVCTALLEAGKAVAVSCAVAGIHTAEPAGRANQSSPPGVYAAHHAGKFVGLPLAPDGGDGRAAALYPAISGDGRGS